MSDKDTDTRSPLSTQRNLNKADEFLDTVAEETDAPDATIETAEMLYRRTLDEQDDYLNWSIRETVAACVYVSSRMNHAAVTPGEIGNAVDIDKNVLFRRSKSLVGELSGTLDISMSDFLSATEYVDRYCEQLELDDDIVDHAKEIIDLSNDAGISYGKSPTGVAAAAVYTASRQNGRKVTQSDISDVADVSEVTIRNRYQEQEELIE